MDTKLDIDVRDLKKAIIDNKLLILSVAMCFFLLAMAYSIFKPLNYQASVLLEVQHTQQSSLGSAANAGNLNNPTGNGTEPASVQIALIYSKYILEKVVNSLGLDIEVQTQESMWDKIFQPKDRHINFSYLKLSAKYSGKPLKLVIEDRKHFRLYTSSHHYLKGQLNQYLNNNDFSLKVSQFSAEPGAKFLISKRPVSTVISNLRAHLTITELSNSSESIVNKPSILQLTLTGNDAQKTMLVLNQIAQVSQQKDRERKSQEAITTLVFLNQQLPIAYNALKDAEAKLNNYRAKSGKIDLKLQTQFLLTHLADIDKQLVALELKRMDMAQQYTVQHPFIVSLNNKKAALLKQRQHVMDQMKTLPASDQVAVNLARDVNVKNTLYMNLLSKIHEQKVITSGIVSDIRILSSAQYADEMFATKKVIVGIASFILGVLLGCAMVIAKRLLSRKIQDPDWVNRNFEIPNFVDVAYSSKAHSIKRDNTLAYNHPNDVTIETLRFLRTLVMNKLTVNEPNIISVLAISEQVGKSFITMNLAALFTVINYKVLVIECDPNIDNSSQLTHLLDKTVSLSEAVISPPENANLKILQLGLANSIGTEMLAGSEFKNLLTKASQDFHFIFINSPPLSYLTQSITLAKLATLNLLVLGANTHSPADITAVLKNIASAGVTIHGSVYNHATYAKNPSEIMRPVWRRILAMKTS